jgi:tRNA threonylcarbamoyladenosine biosynthesis protein TsaB
MENDHAHWPSGILKRSSAAQRNLTLVRKAAFNLLMLLLVADTSGKQGSIALVRAEASAVEVIAEVPLAGGTFSAQLVPQIAGLLANHGFSKTDIGAFVAVAGPGSFTGLRVGLAAIKALAEILQKPIVSVSLLEVIARATETYGNVMAALDAGRSEVYAGEYEPTPNYVISFGEQLLPMSEFVSVARMTVVATPDNKLAESLRSAGIRVIPMDRLSVGWIARVGWQKLHAGQTVSPEQLDANYIRRSDAEIFTKTS